jgi:PAS domain S-box-containing protein
MISVLLVDDDEDHATLVRRTLERQGQPFKVTHAADGFACLAALAREPYSVVLLDYGLPRLNGLQVLERIRALELGVPVVMATGQGDERVAVEAMNAGAIDYVMKTPGYFATLPTVLTKVLKQHELARDNARLYAEARRQQTRLAQIFESTSDGILLVDGAGAIVCANRRAGELLALDPAMVVGLPLVDVVVGGGARAVSALRALLEAPGEDGAGDLELPAGARIVHWMARPTRDEADARIGYTITLQDVTREREISQMKSEFVSFVAHQLRTPLSEIAWMLELAAEEPDIPLALRSYVRAAAASAGRLKGMVNDLLDITRLESGAIGAETEATDLGSLTRSVLHDLAGAIADKGHEMSVRGADELPPVVVDPRLFREVIQNLVSNAVKYTPARGTIAIGMRQAGDEIEWTIEDNGIGIPEAGQHRLFEKFYRAGNAASVDPGGKGLGLYLVRLVLERFGGRIRWTSAEGRGTTFAFTLPLER